jgi:hypothetical protein
MQMTLFDTHDLVEIVHPDYPGERLIACRNPLHSFQALLKHLATLTRNHHTTETGKTPAQTPKTLSNRANTAVHAGSISAIHGKVVNHFATLHLCGPEPSRFPSG